MGSPMYLTGHRVAMLGHPKFELLNHYHDPYAKIIHSLEERAEVWNYEQKEWNKANILYDTGSMVSIAEVGLSAHSVAPLVTRFTSLSTPNGWMSSVCFHSVLRVRSPQEDPLTETRLVVDIPITCVDLPIFSTHRTQYGEDTFQIILGTDSSHLFPDEVDHNQLWAPYAPKYPGLRWKTSRLTRRGLLMGWTTSAN